MKLSFSPIIPLLFLTLISSIALGQSQIEIKLTIDTDCFCNDSLASKLNGKFGVYAYTPIPKYSGNYADTLIRELKLKKSTNNNLSPGKL